MPNTASRVKESLESRFSKHPEDGSSIEQLMTDCAVIVLSNMSFREIDSALFMSLGADGVSKLVSYDREATAN